MTDVFLTIPELVARYPLPHTSPKSQGDRLRHVLNRWIWAGDMPDAVRLRLTKPSGQCGNYPYEYREARVAALILESSQSEHCFCALLRMHHVAALRAVIEDSSFSAP